VKSGRSLQAIFKIVKKDQRPGISLERQSY
jgi:hypothetical protein